MNDLFIDPAIKPDGHVLIVGASGSGKTGLIIKFAMQKLLHAAWGLHVVDPEGDISPALIEFLAAPDNCLAWRKVHHLRAGSRTEAFAIPLLHASEPTPRAAHEAAVRACTVLAQFLNFGLGDFGPRINKLLHLGCFGLALRGLSLAYLPDLYARGATHLRELIADAFPYEFVSDEWRSLDVLSERTFLDYRDPIMSRLLLIFGNEALRRIYGPHPLLDLTRILANREVVLLDLSLLEHKDRNLVGKSYLSALFHAGLQREPNRSPHTCVIIDEVFDLLMPDLARAWDRLRKRGFQMCAAAQRLAQLNPNADDDTAGTLNALCTNSKSKILMSGLEPNDADYMVRLMFSGFIDWSQWRPGDRPVVVGHDKITLTSTAHGTSVSEQTSLAQSRSHTHADATASMTARSRAHGTASASADMSSQLMTPDLLLPMPLSQTAGHSASQSTSHLSARSTGVAHSTSDAYAQADSVSRGQSRATSDTVSQAEALASKIEWLPHAQFSLAEHLNRLAGAAMNLPHRFAFVKIGNTRPVLTRTADLPRNFRSDAFRRAMLPIYRSNLAARSPYVRPAAEADAALAAPLASPAPEPVADEAFTTPDSLPDVGTPQWAAALRSIVNTPQATPPASDSSGSHRANFRVIEGHRDADINS
jgi:hypothetical protein